MNKTNILGVNINNVNKKQAIEILHGFLKKEKHHVVITPNPEIVIKATKDPEFLEIINNSDLIVPDGIGIVIASKFTKYPISERVPGIELVSDLLETAKNLSEPLRIYIFGSKPGVAELAKKNLEEKYKNIKIVGTHSGYFDKYSELNIIEHIKELKPDIILVGLGAPKQEKWIWQNKSLPAKISIGVGGAIDVFAGVVNRAPDIFIKLNLEWLYRVFKEPKRLLRLGSLPLFVIKVIKNKNTN